MERTALIHFYTGSTTVVFISIFILYCYAIVAGQLEYDYYQLAGAGSPRFVLCCVFSFVYLHGWMLVVLLPGTMGHKLPVPQHTFQPGGFARKGKELRWRPGQYSDVLSRCTSISLYPCTEDTTIAIEE